MFFICATVAALSRYWIYRVLINYYHSGNISESTFFHEYMVLLNIALLPQHALLIYLLFYKSGYNYVEFGVLVLYSISVFFLIATGIALFKFFWPQLDTAYVELPIFLIYNTITFMNFFNRHPRWLVVIKSLVFITEIFLCIQMLEDLIIDLIS